MLFRSERKGRTVERGSAGVLFGEDDDGFVDGNDVGFVELDRHLDGGVGDGLLGEVGEGSGESRDRRFEEVVRLLRVAVELLDQRCGRTGRKEQDGRVDPDLAVAKVDRKVARLLECHRLLDADLGIDGEEVSPDRARLGVCSRR